MTINSKQTKGATQVFHCVAREFFKKVRIIFEDI